MKFPFTRVLLIVWLPLFAAACHRRSAAPVASPPTRAAASPVPDAIPAATPGLPEFAVTAGKTREGEAVWYDVPAQSLPARRAWPGEMTAASDALPINTYARVRRVGAGDNGKSVVVRITDSGVRRKGTLIDLDRPAAETLGMVASGAVRVRVETLVLQRADADKPVDRKDAAPAVAKITATPAATREQEKDAAAAKIGGATPP